MLVAGLTGCRWHRRPLAYKVMRQWTAVYACTLLLPFSEELELLQAPLSLPVKPRHSPVPALRVNRRVYIPWLDKQRPEKKKRRRRRRRKKNKGKGRTVHNACGCMCIQQTEENFETVFNRLIGPTNVFCCYTWVLSVFVLKDLEIDI